jgi:hypothetical protein
MEAFDGRKWQLLVLDLDSKAPYNGAILRLLKSDSSRKNVYPTPDFLSRRLSKTNNSINKNYRFVVKYRKRGDTDFLKVVSGNILCE